MMEETCDKSLLTQEKLSLKSWGLPKTILEKYAAKGIENMFPWQVECLTCNGVLSGKNLVYSAPTSAGKTMVAEIITIQTVLERKKKVIFILPFVSVVREKMLYFQNLLGSSGVRVEGFMGSHAPPGGLRTVHIAVCTIEKANSLINRLLEDQGLDAIGCVVVDELHLLGDSHRGYLLELLLTKLKYMCKKDKSVKIQVVGMSATLPNVAELAHWLDAALYTTEFRPIPLTEYLKINSAVYDASTMELKYNIQPIVKFKSDSGDVIHLCLESLLAGHSVLVFCPTRSWCETSAQQIAAEFRRIGYEKSETGLAVRAQLDGDAISDVLEQLKRCPAGLDPSLGRSVAFGVAFHHAGLTMDERDIVEGAFRANVLRVLVATSTLSSGVNLPARRVLIRCPPRNMATDVLGYRQMVGRAGRMGKDTSGESYLICNGSERAVGEQMVRAQLPSVESSLGIGDLSSSLKRAVLEVIASGVVSTSEDVELYTSCTFLANSAGEDSDNSLTDPLAACVEYLQTNEFIRVSGHSLGPTPLAEACLSASLPPDQGLKLLKELHRARQCFVLETELHVIYQVTPYSVSDQWGQLDWLRVLSLWEDLPISMKRVGELVGVEERFLVRAVRGTVNKDNSAQKLSIHRRFYTALALQDLVNEVPLPQVAVKFDCSKGVLQSLQQSASTFAGMVTQFTRRLGWSNVELLVSQFAARLQFGAQRELLDLLRLDCLTAVQARALYNNGIQSLADLATASMGKVEKGLARATPFQSDQDEGTGSDHCRIWLVARCAVTEAQAANILIQEARQHLERELGLQGANWGDLNASINSSASERSQPQALETPVRPIGQEIVALDNNKVIKTEENSKNNTEENKQDKSLEGTLLSKVTEKDVMVATKVTDISSSLVKCNDNKNLLRGNQPTISVEKLVQEDTANKNKLYECGKDFKINCEMGAPSKMTAASKKRGSLDLFDSPEQIDKPNNVPHNDSGRNIEEINFQLNTDMIENLKYSNISQTDQKTTQIKTTENNIDELSIKSNCLIENIPSEPTTSKKLVFSSGKGTNSKSQVNASLTNNTDQSLFNNSVFFDSPIPDELVVSHKHSVLEQLDANVGGESLLEISSFVASSKGRNDLNEEKCDLWFTGIEKDPLVEISSLIVSTDGKKRKQSRCNINESKRIKLNAPRNTEGNQMKTEPSELQVSKVTSTNSNLKPITTSTPTLSQYFDGSINFDSPFSFDENIGNVETQNKIVNNDSIVNPDVNAANTVNHEFTNGSNNENNLSFELRLSSDNSFPDNEFNINSNIFDDLDSENNSLNCQNSKNISSCKNDIFNSGSKPNEPVHTKTSLLDGSETKRKRGSDERKILPESNSFKNDVNKCLFKEGAIIDSKLSALVYVKDVLQQTNKDKINNSNPFVSNLSLDTQLCGLLDEENNLKVENHRGEWFGSETKSFGNSEFNIDTQLCNVIDNVATDNYNKNENEKYDSKKPIWTESMELKEIQELNFDEETVFGTPVNHQKSILFKKPGGKKMKINKITDSAKHKAYNEPDQDNINQIGSLGRNTLNENSKIVLDKNTLKSKQLSSSKTNYPNTCSLKRPGKENKKSFDNESQTVQETLLNKSSVKSTGTCNSITDTFLAAAFESSFNQQSQKAEMDEIESSQQTPVTPHKTFRERVQKVDSPTINKNESQVEVVTVCDEKTRQEFRSYMLICKSVSLVLTTRVMEDCDGRGIIGAKIVKKRSEFNYQCCHQGIAVTSAVICSENLKVYIVSLSNENYTSNIEVLREMLSRTELLICSWEAKLTIKLLQQCCHLQCETKLSDPTVAEWLLKPHQQTPTIKQLARSYGVSVPKCSVEAGFTALLVWELNHLLKTKLKQSGLYRSYTGVEMPTQKLLVELEVVGVGWDREYIELLWTAVEEKMADLQNTLYSLAGKKFNLRSRTDLAKIKKLMKGSSEESLAEFNTVLRNWRVLNSLKTRNMSGLLMQEGDRIRGSWEAHTVTGRISMQEPSLQHIPRDIVIDDQVFSLRSAFVASSGNILVSADFCQLELRLLAHFSQDAALLETFLQPGDVFTAIAAEWNNIPQDQVGAELRQHTKQLCYGLIYGMGTGTLAEEMGVDEAQAEDMVTSFHNSYPGLKGYVGRCVGQCRASSYVTTLKGRRRYLPDISSNNKALRAQAERQAVNTTIQGSAADIAKIAMLKVSRAVQQTSLQAQLIIHLHDELIYEVAEKDSEDFVRVLRNEMESAVTLSVPLPVKVKKGPSWGQLELID